MSGLVGWITIAGGVPAGAPALAGCCVTVCCGVVLRLPAVCAWARSRWMEAATSDCWAIIASPTFWVQSSLLFIIARTCGKATSDVTLTSQPLSLTAARAAAPLRLGLSFDQRAASTTSSG